MVEVVAALLRRGEKFLICRRPAYKARGLLWEFVGGKIEAGESAEQALCRECREELGVEVRADRPFAEVTHVYPDIIVHLRVFEAHIESGEPRPLEHAELRWVHPSEIGNFAFCPADEPVLRLLGGGGR